MTRYKVLKNLGKSFNITDAEWPRLRLWTPNKIVTSDEFTSAISTGSWTDARLGGSPYQWGQVKDMSTAGGRLVNNEWGFASMLLESTSFDFTFIAASVSGSWGQLSIRPNVWTAGDRLRLIFRRDSTSLERAGIGFSEVLATLPPVTNGDRFTYRQRGRTFEILINGGAVGGGVFDEEYPQHDKVAVGFVGGSVNDTNHMEIGSISVTAGPV